MLKVYGTDICIDCRNYKAIQKKRGFEAEYINITENTGNLKAFLEIRDKDSVFVPVKERGGIGVPLFVREDGTKTFDIDEALSWIGEESVKENEIAELYSEWKESELVETKIKLIPYYKWGNRGENQMRVWMPY